MMSARTTALCVAVAAASSLPVTYCSSHVPSSSLLMPLTCNQGIPSDVLLTISHIGLCTWAVQASRCWTCHCSASSLGFLHLTPGIQMNHSHCTYVFISSISPAPSCKRGQWEIKRHSAQVRLVLCTSLLHMLQQFALPRGYLHATGQRVT